MPKFAVDRFAFLGALCHGRCPLMMKSTTEMSGAEYTDSSETGTVRVGYVIRMYNTHVNADRILGKCFQLGQVEQ